MPTFEIQPSQTVKFVDPVVTKTISTDGAQTDLAEPIPVKDFVVVINNQVGDIGVLDIVDGEYQYTAPDPQEDTGGIFHLSGFFEQDGVQIPCSADLAFVVHHGQVSQDVVGGVIEVKIVPVANPE